jgi:alkylation response protein AidB-like acyl-CoA dehydrogenase
MSTATRHKLEMLRTLPSDAARQIQWSFADRYELQMLVQSVRAVARGPVARLVAQGGRNTHEWTPAKAEMLEAFDQSGITAVFMDPEQGGFIAGPRNLPPPASPDVLLWHRFTSAAPRNSRIVT